MKSPLMSHRIKHSLKLSTKKIESSPLDSNFLLDFLKCKSIRPILVSIIDTGLDLNHPFFNDLIWKNPGEVGFDNSGNRKESNGIDDDNNGFIDDVQGWNFVDNSPNVIDRNGHGTHVAGLAAGFNQILNSNEKCIPNIKIMILKYYSEVDSFEVNVKNTISAIKYANMFNVDIINYSAGGRLPNILEEKAIRESLTKNILFVTAAGNENQNLNFFNFYPASYKLKNIIPVTAINLENKLLIGSSYGNKIVKYAAPGEAILSTYINHQFKKMTGTSQSTAVVTSQIASILSNHDRFENLDEILNVIDQHTVKHEKLNHFVSNGQTLSLFNLSFRKELFNNSNN